ncbi:MAG: alkaline phosphatase family protein [Treponema sp.]|nr:alkaline phosphatase family protein [Treponema sp.]
MKKIVYPDYKNCIENVSNSILKYYGLGLVGDSLPLLDEQLKKPYKNVVLLLLDGMGKNILEKHLSADGTFRKNLKGIYKSVFLSTTTAATTSLFSGLQPCEHSWLGWDCYYPQIDKNVTVFLNVEQGTKTPAADFDIPRTFTPFENIVDKISKAGIKTCHIAPYLFKDKQNLTIDLICKKIKECCDEPERKFVYAYWNNPDGDLHNFGVNSEQVHNTLIHIEKTVAELTESLEDTLFIITADHGHLDTDGVKIQNYPKIMNCLERMPSLEPRVLNFFVKPGMEASFEKEFNKEFGTKFILMPMQEALDKKLFGDKSPEFWHKCFRSMLGNYLAIAIDNLSIFFDDELLMSMHGGLTEEEMLIPLIVMEK